MSCYGYGSRLWSLNRRVYRRLRSGWGKRMSSLCFFCNFCFFASLFFICFLSFCSCLLLFQFLDWPSAFSFSFFLFDPVRFLTRHSGNREIRITITIRMKLRQAEGLVCLIPGISREVRIQVCFFCVYSPFPFTSALAHLIWNPLSRGYHFRSTENRLCFCFSYSWKILYRYHRAAVKVQRFGRGQDRSL